MVLWAMTSVALLLLLFLLASSSSSNAAVTKTKTTTTTTTTSTVQDDHHDHPKNDDINNSSNAHPYNDDMGAMIRLALHLNTTSIVGTVDSRYVSYTMDYPGDDDPHKKSNVLRLNLQSHELRTLTKALGPAIFRIGGTLEKIVQYEFPTNSTYARSCNHTNTITSSSTRSHHSKKKNDYYVPCLTSRRWDELHEFAAHTNSQIVFGLSYPDDRNPKNTSGGRWTRSDQAKDLLKYSLRRNYTRRTTFWGVELGEELTRFQVNTLEFDNYIRAYHRCARILQMIFEPKNDGIERPYLMGPCPGMSWPKLATWFPTFLNATQKVLDIAVYHSYNQIEPGKLYVNLTVPSGNIYTQKGWSPGDTGWQAVAMNQFVQQQQLARPKTKLRGLWLGEMASHNHVGGNAICGTFASSFSYLDTLGTLARLNHRVVARQTLTGGSYGLVRATSGRRFEPRPDYWVALLWKRFMGQTVLQAPRVVKQHQQQQVSSGIKDNDSWWKEPLRFHAHCTRVDRVDDERGGEDDGLGSSITAGEGSVTIAFSNMSPNQTYAIVATTMSSSSSSSSSLLPPLQQQVLGGGGNKDLGRTRIEYFLQGHPKHKGFDSEVLALNGNVLRLDRSSSSSNNSGSSLLPSLKGRVVDNRLQPWMVVEPITLGFVVFPRANVTACYHHHGRGHDPTGDTSTIK